MKFVNYLFMLLVLIVFSFGVLMIWKAWKSQKMQPKVGIIDSKLMACGDKPNCVSSFSNPDSPSYIEPIKSNQIKLDWDNLQTVLTNLDIKIETSTPNYIHATQTTPIMKFVDDIEFLIHPEENQIHIRSASRVGYSDLGANRKRLTKIKSSL